MIKEEGKRQPNFVVALDEFSVQSSELCAEFRILTEHYWHTHDHAVSGMSMYAD